MSPKTGVTIVTWTLTLLASVAWANVVLELSKDICQDPTFDTIVKTEDEDYFVFSGSKYWKVVPYESTDGPYPIADSWTYLPNDIEAAITMHDGLTYFFKAGRFYAYDTSKGNELVNQGSSGIVLPGVVSEEIDAVEYYDRSKSLLVYRGYRQLLLESLDQTREIRYLGEFNGTEHIIAVVNYRHVPLMFFDDGTYKENKYGHNDNAPGDSTVKFMGCTSDSSLDVCQDGKFDTIVLNDDEEYFVFRGANYYEVTPFESIRGPFAISEGWLYLPSDVEAAFTMLDGLTYFFKRGTFYAYDTQKGNTMVNMGTMNTVLPNIIGPINAVEYYDRTKNILVYQGEHQFLIDVGLKPREVSYVNDIERMGRVMGVVEYQHHPMIFFRDGTCKVNTYMRKDTEPRQPITSFLGCKSQ